METPISFTFHMYYHRIVDVQTHIAHRFSCTPRPAQGELARGSTAGAKDVLEFCSSHPFVPAIGRSWLIWSKINYQLWLRHEFFSSNTLPVLNAGRQSSILVIPVGWLIQNARIKYDCMFSARRWRHACGAVIHGGKSRKPKIPNIDCACRCWMAWLITAENALFCTIWVYS